MINILATIILNLRILFYGVLLSLVVSSAATAQEYHQEVFLRFPTFWIEGGEGPNMGPHLSGPSGMGIDETGRIYLHQREGLCFYDQDGLKYRILNLIDDRGKKYNTPRICFDDEGFIYSSRNVSGEVTVRKFNPEGELIGIMKNDLRAMPDPRKERPFLGKFIHYIPEYGLVLNGPQWEHIPITFSEGINPEMTLNDKIINGLMIDANNWINCEYISRHRWIIKVHLVDRPTETIILTAEENLGCHMINSGDWNHQYYLLIRYGDRTGDPQMYEIRKYDGATLIFSTGELVRPPLGIWPFNCVVDNNQTIYLVHGDEDEVRILRWILE